MKRGKTVVKIKRWCEKLSLKERKAVITAMILTLISAFIYNILIDNIL